MTSLCEVILMEIKLDSAFETVQFASLRISERTAGNLDVTGDLVIV